MKSYDAVIIGTGPNALVNAALLTKAGWSVLMLEKSDRPGGGLRSQEITQPGFLHDVYAGFLILFAISPGYAELAKELTDFGLVLANSGNPAGVSLPGDKATLITTDMSANMAEADRLSVGDGAAWANMFQQLGQYANELFGLSAMDLTLPVARQMIHKLMMSPDGANASPFSNEFLVSARTLLESTFTSDVWRAVLAPWVLHGGHGPEETNSGYGVQMFALGVQNAGLPVAVGGAEMMAKALAGLIKSKGGKIITNTTVNKILVKNGKAVGVTTEEGEEYHAKRVVIATTTPDQLYLKLLAHTDIVPPLIKKQAQKFRYGHSVFSIHLALSEPPKWHDERLNKVTYTHVTSGLDGLSRNYNQTTCSLLPSEPVIGVGTPTTLDPSRAPEGKAIMVLQGLDTPYRMREDSAGKIDVGEGFWSEDLKNRYADRMIDLVGSRIPNLKSSILGRALISPLDLEKGNLNWRFGDPYSGSHDISQHYIYRPLPSQSGHQTVIPNLFMIGASTYPGLGLGGTSGYIVAKKILSEAS